MTLSRSSWICVAVFALLAIYLFASAPPELPDGRPAGPSIPAQAALAVLDAENASIRALYTREIVGAGSRQGLEYREDWRREDVMAGPLPALLLRETSNRLQLRMPELGLFLGSDFPLVKENRFSGPQAQQYVEVKRTLRPRSYFDPALGRTVAMFPDFATTQACVDCHNAHPNAVKKDWVLNEPMGAITWSYAGRQVSPELLLRMIAELRRTATEAYGAYLQKAAAFPEGRRPAIGTKWPREGLYLPDLATFRGAIDAANAGPTLQALLATAPVDAGVAEAKR